jgi:hypothetical protein
LCPTPAALADGRKQLKTKASKTNASSFFIEFSLYIPLQNECQSLNVRSLNFPAKIAAAETFLPMGKNYSRGLHYSR